MIFFCLIEHNVNIFLINESLELFSITILYGKQLKFTVFVFCLFRLIMKLGEGSNRYRSVRLPGNGNEYSKTSDFIKKGGHF